MTGTLAMAAASSMLARIKFGTSRTALQRCFGAAHLALCERWVTLIGRERQIATSWLAGKVIDLRIFVLFIDKLTSPTLVANLWDVTDKDIDKFSQSVFEKLNLSANYLKEVRQAQEASRTSVIAAVAQSRDVCKLKYLTGAAPVVYGIPFYL